MRIKRVVGDLAANENEKTFQHYSVVENQVDNRSTTNEVKEPSSLTLDKRKKMRSCSITRNWLSKLRFYMEFHRGSTWFQFNSSDKIGDVFAQCFQTRRLLKVLAYSQGKFPTSFSWSWSTFSLTISG